MGACVYGRMRACTHSVYLGQDDMGTRQDMARDEGIESFRKEEITRNVKCNRGPLTNK